MCYFAPERCRYDRKKIEQKTDTKIKWLLILTDICRYIVVDIIKYLPILVDIYWMSVMDDCSRFLKSKILFYFYYNKLMSRQFSKYHRPIKMLSNDTSINYSSIKIWFRIHILLTIAVFEIIRLTNYFVV